MVMCRLSLIKRQTLSIQSIRYMAYDRDLKHNPDSVTHAPFTRNNDMYEHGCFSFCLVIMLSVDFLNNRTNFC